MDESLLSAEDLAARGRPMPLGAFAVTETMARHAHEVFGSRPMVDETAQGATPLLAIVSHEADVRGIDVPNLRPTLPSTLLSNNELVVFRRPRFGERMEVVLRVTDMVERFGGRFGHSVNVRNEFDFRDAAGETALRIVNTILHFSPANDAQRPADEASAEPAPFELPTTESAATPAAAREGDDLPAWQFTPTITDTVRYCAACWHFDAIFFDNAAAQGIGMPSALAPGQLKLGWLYRYVSDWLGAAGEITSIRAAHRRPDLVGRPIAVFGRVVRLEPREDGRDLDVEISVRQQDGRESIRGYATIALPR
jgi:hypothetical protein